MASGWGSLLKVKQICQPSVNISVGPFIYDVYLIHTTVNGDLLETIAASASCK